jgi:hypothetical protein
MRAVAEHAPALSGKALKRAEAAMARRGEPEEFDVTEGRKTFAALIGGGRTVVAQRAPRAAARPTGRKTPSRRVARQLGRTARGRRS